MESLSFKALLMMLLLVMPPSSNPSSTPAVGLGEYVSLSQEVNCYQQEVESLEEKVDILESRIPKFAIKDGVRLQMHPNLARALYDAQPPDPFLVTSIWRPWDYGSLHQHGCAFDVRFCPHFVRWLMSKDGLEWADKHEIDWFVEQGTRPGTKIPRKHRKEFGHMAVTIAKATGPHIHFQVLP